VTGATTDGPPPPESLPADSDVDLHVPQQRAELRRAPWAVLGAVSAGGALGAVARHALAVAVPDRPDGFPWATFLTNVSGCLLLGVLMVLITEVWPGTRLVRPFLGVGVLGGYTTFSTYAVQIQRLAAGGEPVTAVLYLAGTLAAALAAVQTGIAVARLATRAARRTGQPR
jgi:CrcB protein